jgi:hypothetical protein
MSARKNPARRKYSVRKISVIRKFGARKISVEDQRRQELRAKVFQRQKALEVQLQKDLVKAAS